MNLLRTKIIVIILVATLVSLSLSCGDTCGKVDETNYSDDWRYKLTKIEFEGHEYIVLKGGATEGNGLAICHSENCKYCKQLKTNVNQ